MYKPVRKGMKLPFCDLPRKTLFFAGGYLCKKINDTKCFIFEKYKEARITDLDAIVEVAA